MCGLRGCTSREYLETEHNLTEAHMKTQKLSKYQKYEQQKSVILNQKLSPKEYQSKIKALAQKLGV